MNNIVAFNPCFVCPKDGKCSMCELNMYRQGTLSNPQWISANDRLPEGKFGEELIICTEDGEVGAGRYSVFKDEGEFSWMENEGSDFYSLGTNSRVTHWMPLPEAPKMKGGE